MLNWKISQGCGILLKLLKEDNFMFAYRIGAPGWKLAARLGVPLKAKVFVVYDPESRSLVGECNDFEPYLGIVTEGETFEELSKKLKECFEMGLEESFKKPHASSLVKPSMTLVGALP